MGPLGYLTETNQAPTDDERDSLKETLADYVQKLNAITHRISELEKHLRSSKEEKKALLKASSPIRRALSPFRQLPEDIVRAIFVACLETRWNPTMANTEAPILLTRISRATRMIAFTTPELWTAIHIPIITSVPIEVMDTAESIMTARTEVVKEWLLRRSGNLPLSISVYEKPRVRAAHFLNLDIADALIDVLVACCSRWKNAHFSCRPTILSHISPLNDSDVPLLKSLAISSFAHSEDGDTLWRDSGILKAPMLTRFRQLGSSPVSFYPIKWSSLTHLYWTQVNTDVFNGLANVLRQAAGLVRLDLTAAGSGTFSIGTISLPCLTTLVVTEFSVIHPEGNDIGIFGAIHAPSLETISYNADRHGVQRSPALITCLKNSSNIEEVIMGQPQSLDILVEYLGHCSSLLFLHIPAPDSYAFDEKQARLGNKKFLDAFNQDDPAQCLCPQLEYFRFDPNLALSLHTLRSFLMRRNGTIPGLSRLKAVMANVIYDPVEEVLVKEIMSVGRAGDTRLEVSFKKRRGYSQEFDSGIDCTTSLVNSRWPFGIIADMTHLH